MGWVRTTFGGRYGLAALVVIALLLCAVSIFAYSLSRPSTLLAGLPAATLTAGGHGGDPLNVLVIGDKAQLDKVYRTAHWLIPDPIDEVTTAAIIKASILNSSYPSAPVSNLYLFSRHEDVAFEYPTDSVRQRHHIRLWLLSSPLGGKQAWIGAATYDSGIELSGATHLPTHHISPNVDSERTFVARSLQATGLVSDMRLERLTFPTFWQTNGGGDWYFDDGNVEIVTLR